VEESKVGSLKRRESLEQQGDAGSVLGARSKVGETLRGTFVENHAPIEIDVEESRSDRLPVFRVNDASVRDLFIEDHHSLLPHLIEDNVFHTGLVLQSYSGLFGSDLPRSQSDARAGADSEKNPRRASIRDHRKEARVLVHGRVEGIPGRHEHEDLQLPDKLQGDEPGNLGVYVRRVHQYLGESLVE